MTPANFPEANTKFGPPAGFDESHCRTIPAFLGQMGGGPFDGETVVIVAWKPSLEDLEILKRDGLIYLSVFGGLMPHYLSTDLPQELRKV